MIAGPKELQKFDPTMSSLLRVLVVGDNSNIPLYASRFRLAKSVELYHVSDTKSNHFQVETAAYGKDEFQLENHFTSVAHLEEAMKQTGETGIIFDLIILSAMSLQEMSSLASQLNPMININSKIFLESSGFVQLEQFVKMSMDLPQLNIFSIVTDYDFRQVGPNQYKQFVAPGTQNSIYLGDSSPVASKKQNSQSSRMPSGNGAKYPKNVGTLLATFQKLFEKLFPHDRVDLCNSSQTDFLSTMWTVAIPKICFDPLLILLEETDPQQLNQQVLAKPLISGLVTEVITILKSMGGKLPTQLESENGLLSHWQSMYAGTGQMPATVYHFVNRTAPLNIDMLLLQPILLADDYYIKTPYLEFLYSLMCQYQKLNDGTSKWFMRREESGLQSADMASLTEQNNQLQSQLVSLHKSSDERDDYLKKVEADAQASQSQVAVLQKQIASLRQVIVEQSQKHDSVVQELRQAQQQQTQQPPPLQRDLNGSNDQVASFTSAQGELNPYSDNYGPGGTPDMRDIENFALLGVNYGDTPQRDAARQQPPHDPSTSPSAAANANGFAAANGMGPSGSQGSAGSEFDRTLKERELEIRRKELELQERELNFQQRAVQQQQQQQQHRQHKFSQTPPSPTLGTNRRPSHPQLQQAPGLRSNRNMHGAAAGGFGPAGPVGPVGPAAGYGDPMAVNGKMHRATAAPGFNQGNLQAAAPLQSQPHYPPHAIKPTSRKNRHSNMPTIGNASSLGFNDYGRPGGNAGGGGVGQSRVNSMSTGNLVSNAPMPKNIRQSSAAGLNYGANGSNLRLNSPPGKQAPGVGPFGSDPNARTFSSGTNNGMEPTQLNPDVSANSLVHNPMNSQGSKNNNLQVPGASDNGGMGNQTSQPPVLQVNGTQSQPPNISPSAQDTSTESKGAEAVPTEESPAKGDKGDKAEKGKKKKFGLFGKKKKSKK